MNRTQSHYLRANSKNRSMHHDNSSAFHGIKQTYIYKNLPKPTNTSGQFEGIPRKTIRSEWEMKNHSFEFEWPKKQEKTTPIRISVPAIETERN